VRADGERVVYDPATNTFVVPPEAREAYFDDQK
jgi:hypothetical protein